MRFMIDAVILQAQLIVVYDYVYVATGSRIYAGPEGQDNFWLPKKNEHQSMTSI